LPAKLLSSTVHPASSAAPALPFRGVETHPARMASLFKGIIADAGLSSQWCLSLDKQNLAPATNEGDHRQKIFIGFDMRPACAQANRAAW